METNTTTPKTGTGKDVYTIVTERIIEQLEKGTVPWRQPWQDAGLPANLISRRPYRGINVMLLAGLGYAQNFFLTYKQLTELGGKVKKDEKGHMVVFWKYGEASTEHSDGEEHDEAPGKKKKAILRYYNVFNIEQCENIPEDKLPALIVRNNVKPIVACEKVLNNMPQCPEIKYKEHRAYYDPTKDFINMPKQKTFESDDAFYATLFHELVHSTGHHSRLHRKDLIEMSEFGSEAYSHEELVAEIGTCYLQSHVGITGQFEQSTAYIQGWLGKLENDKRFIFSASREAQKATDFILDTQPEEQKQEDEE